MKIDEIRKLKNASTLLKNLYPNYREKIKDSSCDKYALKFGGDDRFSVFKATVFLDCHIGYYGNSSCSRMGDLDNTLASSLLNRALNRHMVLILETMAEFAAEDASELVVKAEEELASLQSLIDSVKQSPEPQTTEP